MADSATFVAGQRFARRAYFAGSAADIESLMQACPELLQQSDTIEWDETQGTLKALRRSRIGQLTVKVQPLAKPSEEEPASGDAEWHSR